MRRVTELRIAPGLHDPRLPLGPDDFVIRGEAMADPLLLAAALAELGAACAPAGWVMSVAVDAGVDGTPCLHFSAKRRGDGAK